MLRLWLLQACTRHERASNIRLECLKLPRQIVQPRPRVLELMARAALPQLAPSLGACYEGAQGRRVQIA